MKSNLMRQIKDVSYDFVDNLGVIGEKPKGLVIKRELSEVRVNFLKSFLDLVLNSKMTSKYTKIYLSDRYITYKGVLESVRNMGEEMDETKIRGKISYDKRKISQIFGNDFLIEVIDYNNNEDNINRYRQLLSDVKLKYSQSFNFDSIALNIREPEEIVSEVDVEEFNDFIKTILPYCKSHMEYIENSIPDEVLGYIKYLNSTDVLNSEDLKRKKKLEEIL